MRIFGRVWSSIGREQVVYNLDQAVGGAWSGNLGDRYGEVGLITSSVNKTEAARLLGGLLCCQFTPSYTSLKG